MSDSQQKTSENNGPSSFDQTEEIFNGFVELLREKEFNDLLEKCNSAFVTASPSIELTDDDLAANEQAKIAERLQRRFEYARKLSKTIMKRISGSPDSELFKTTKKALDLLDEIEAGTKNRWRELDTTLYTLVQLCRAEDKKTIGSEQKTDLASRKQNQQEVEDGSLEVRYKKAYQSYCYAVGRNTSIETDKQAYDWLKENGCEDEDYRLPSFETWQRYVQSGRKFYATQKNKPRSGRTGRSIVRSKDL